MRGEVSSSRDGLVLEREFPPVGADPIMTTWGCGHLLGLVQRNQAQAFTVLDGAE